MTAVFEDVLRDLVIASNLAGTRVYVMRAPQKPTVSQIEPYMVLAPTGPEPLHTHEGGVGLLLRNYQISIFDKQQSVALALADSLVNWLDGYRGEFQGVDFAYVMFALQTALYETDTQLFHIICEFRVRFRLLSNFSAVNNGSKHGNKRSQPA